MRKGSKKKQVIHKITPSFDSVFVESEYEKALKSMPDWDPAKNAKILFLDAIKMLNRLSEEGRVPKCSQRY